ncbi:papd4-a [Symbiodinium natans]|uniref:Papd4-a protein n=1 Tax=Symbiodinium natans TaxID=878477 RepID=A0A812SQN7_9DINO|nr:papd4-a [Symbiodinium natans]
MMKFLIIALSGDERKHHWLGSSAKSAPLQSLAQQWAQAHSVSETGVALEKDGSELDLSRSPSDYAWETEQVELYSWPTKEEYMEEDSVIEPAASSAVEGTPTTARLNGEASSSTRPEPESTKKGVAKPSQVKLKPETKKTPGGVKPKPKASRSKPAGGGAENKEAIPGPDDPIEFLQQNPKKAGGKGFDRYEKYKSARTITEAMSLGAAKGDIQFDWQRGWLRRK